MAGFIGDTGGGGTAFGALTWNQLSSAAALGTKFLTPYENGPDAAEYFQLVAGVGTYTRITVVATLAFTTDSFTYTVRKNGVDTALVAVLAAGAVSVTGTGSVSVVDGDRISVKVVQSGAEVKTSRNGIGVY